MLPHTIWIYISVCMVRVCSISSSINLIESQCAPAILCDVWLVWVCVRLCACPCVLPRYFCSAHTNTTTHCTSNSNQIAFYSYRTRLFSSSSLRMSKLPSSLHTHNFPSSSSSFSWFISVSSAYSHACLLACSLATARDVLVCFGSPVLVCALRVNAIREIIIAVNVLLETTKQLQSSYISRRKEAKQ